MTQARFLQIHTLHSYAGALLNRDDSGLAKRLPYGGAMRTRISSQCLKRHWRLVDDPHALSAVQGFVDSKRSREIVTLRVIEPLRAKYSEATINLLNDLFQKAVYGDRATLKSARQTLLLGAPEIDWLSSQAAETAAKIENTLNEAAKAPLEKPANDKEFRVWFKLHQEAATTITDEWMKGYKTNIKQMREQTITPGGLAAALFGRMVTSDVEANIDAPIHVAHAFTVHAEESESDYFTAVDDLKRDEDVSGADTIQETELTSGLYYGYVVVDVHGLIENTSGAWRDQEDFASVDRSFAAEIVHNLLYLISEVSPGAKLGSTAPYGRAEFLMVEAGDRQPRSLAAAFREPTPPRLGVAQSALTAHLAALDRAYATDEARRVMHLANEEIDGLQRGSLPEIAAWAREAVRTGAAS